MARGRSNTRTEITEVALELFARNGYERTSLREISDRLNITKAALYYYFPSKLDVLRALMQPYTDDAETWLTAAESDQQMDRRDLVGGFYDLSVRHRKVLRAALADSGAMEALGVVEQVLSWRQRLHTLLIGPTPGPQAQAAAVIAVGGLLDCTMLLPEPASEPYREAALQAALRALDG
ncbi:MAG TPA: helix-turn-helix domain-containing protein [Beutenbergiaceae bacterium]|nr:helix-turn-helix domain-containing protein [Beutenbergiaceae bacterium]